MTTNVTADDLVSMQLLAKRNGWFHAQLSQNLRDLRADVIVEDDAISISATDAVSGLNLRVDRDGMLATVHHDAESAEPGDEIVVHSWKAKYLDILLPHPETHSSIESILDPFVEQSASTIVNRDGRTGMPRNLEELSARICKEVGTSVVRRPVPFGVSALLVAREGDTLFGLVTKRTDQVAVNPGVITTAIDGGLSAGKDPFAQVCSEAADELRGAVDMSELMSRDGAVTLAGLLIPGDDPLRLAGDFEIRRTGVGAVFLVEVEKSLLDSTLAMAQQGIDDRKFFVEGHPAIVDVRELLRDPPGPLSEPLVAAAVLAIGAEAAGEFEVDVRNTPVRASESKETRGMATNDSRKEARTALDLSGMNPNQRFAASMIRRFPHLDRRCAALEDFQENSVTPDHELDYEEAARQLLEVIIEYRHVSDDELGYFNRGRLYEALIYQVHRHVFNTRIDDAKRMVKIFASDEYDDALDFNVRDASRAYANSIVVSPVDVEAQHPDWARRDFLDRASRDGLTSVEAEQLRAAIHRLAFCCTIVEMERLETPEAAAYVLHRDNRAALSGDPMALIFKARGMFISPVLSGAQLMTGFQYALAGLERYERQAGFHHTVALFELRLAASENSDESRTRRIESALARVDRSIELDPEVADLYVTRARIKKLLARPADARVDLEAAIELERFVSEGRADESERMRELKNQLELIAQ